MKKKQKTISTTKADYILNSQRILKKADYILSNQRILKSQEKHMSAVKSQKKKTISTTKADYILNSQRILKRKADYILNSQRILKIHFSNSNGQHYVNSQYIHIQGKIQNGFTNSREKHYVPKKKEIFFKL